MRRALLVLAALIGLCSGAELRAADAAWPDALQQEAGRIVAMAAADGLDPADYRELPPPEAMRRYLRHLHLGRVRAKELGFRVGASTDEEIDGVLQSAVAEGRLQTAVERLTPPLAQYRHLREALARYRGLGAAPPWSPLPPVARKLVSGDAYAGAVGLRERLTAYGDLPADAVTAAERYDDVLAAAVQRFQQRHGLDTDGVIGRATLAALNVSPATRVRQIELAMERLRWLPHRSGRPFIAINIPMFRLWAWDAGAPESTPALGMGVIVGRALRTQTPVFADQMTHLIFRPYWNVPRSILRNEVLPAAERDPTYLARHDMELVSGQGDDAKPVAATAENLEAARAGALRIRQRPGPKNSLGLVKFIFPNDDNVYLHGTPARELFARSRRDFSHGCVRLENPSALAQWLLKDQPAWTKERIDAAMNGAKSQQVDLSAPVPVILYYVSAAVMPEDGTLHFADDIYGHDAVLERALKQSRTN